MPEQYPGTTLFGTEERTLFCPTRGREYHLSVALPDGYYTNSQAYPVIYVLDADVIFGMAAGLTPIARWFTEAPEAILVGISYGMESYDQWVQLRERDFKVPAVRDAPADSAADRFLAALTQEISHLLKPTIVPFQLIAACMAIRRVGSLCCMRCSISPMLFSVISRAAVISILRTHM